MRKQCKELTKQQIKEFSSLKLKGHFPHDQQFNIKLLTFSQDKDGRYFVSMSYEKIAPKKHSVLETKNVENLSLIGCDLGLKSKLTSSDGLTYNTDLPYKDILDEKTKLQKQLSKKVERKKSNIVRARKTPAIPNSQYKKLLKIRKKDKYKNKENDRLQWKVIRKDNSFSKEDWKQIYESGSMKRLQKKCNRYDVKSANIRRYQNHILSKEIVDSKDVICLEDLNVSGMKKLWGKKISDLALSQLVDFICYKAENQGKIAYQINRFYPSSKTCCMCQNKKKDLSLNDRSWTCTNCGQNHDRDINASINIFVQGIKEMNIDGVDILDKKQKKDFLHSFWNDVSAKMFYKSETPNALHDLLGLEDVVDDHCDSSSLDELKDAPVIAYA